MEAQGRVKFEGATSISYIRNTITQQLTTTNTTAKAEAEPGRTQEALAGFTKGLKDLYILYQGCFSS